MCDCPIHAHDGAVDKGSIRAGEKGHDACDVIRDSDVADYEFMVAERSSPNCESGSRGHAR
jgi:hypothetical protein